jgi:hypothetical protein
MFDQPKVQDSRWISVVFLQGQEARYLLSMIELRGAPAAIEYLRNWDHGKWATDAALTDAYVYDRIRLKNWNS